MAKIKKVRPKKSPNPSARKPIRTASARLKVSSAKPNTSEAAQRSATSPAPRMALVEIIPPNRQEMIAVAAYYKAEKREFTPGSEGEDWLEAEKEIDRISPLI